MADSPGCWKKMGRAARGIRAAGRRRRERRRFSNLSELAARETIDMSLLTAARKPKQYIIKMFFKPQPVHFIGIGGIGMSGLAEVLLDLGYQVSGSDLKNIADHGAPGRTRRRHYRRPRRRKTGRAKAVVVSSAVRPDNPEVVEARRLRFR